ncbi:MAG: Gfo/Idh/MocA family oxidoreductase [Phycisphaeraceae bacterium]|nr:Gfo/Idh/MocA family oxidoreductase [Phycisphaeraceae bacterium]
MTAAPLSRRTFVQATTAAAALLAVPRVWGRAPGSERLRVGLIGCGGRGRGAAVQAISADPAVQLWAVGDVFPDHVDAAVQSFAGITELADRIDLPPERQFVGIDAFQKVIDSGVDMVILATPPHFRPAHLEAAVAAGKHVFCEKPVCVDVPGYHRVQRALREAQPKGLNIASGFCWRSSEPERQLVERLRAGRIGDVVAIHALYLTSPLGTRPRQESWSDLEFQLRNWQHFTWLSGDHLVEQAVHSADKLLWFMDGALPVRCTATGGRGVRESIPERGDSWDHFAVSYEYADGRRSLLMCRQQPGTHQENTEGLVGTRGFGFVNGWGPRLELTGADPWQWSSDRMPPNMYEVQQRELVEAILGRRERIFHDFMADSCYMAILGREAAYSGALMEWDRFQGNNDRLGPETYEFGPLPFPEPRRPGQRRRA